MEGMKVAITKPDVLMKGHAKKVALVQFNPTANSILASGSFDRSVKIWNIETAECVHTFNDMKDNVYSLEWNADGSQLAVTGKDRKLRIFDPRVADEAACVNAFEGTKSSKCFWISNLGWIGAVGFSKGARRQLRMWDLKDLSKPVFSTDIDQVASVLMPHYDNDIGVLYMSGKGDGTVSFGEIINDARKYYSLGSYRATEPQKGGGWIPKKACDVWKCEVGRFLKLTKNSIIPISFIVPRKSGADIFQSDIYPDCFAGKPALSGDEWISGKNKDALTMSMDPSKKKDDSGSKAHVFKKQKTRAELLAENAELKKYVAELEKKLGIKPKKDGKDEEKEDEEDAEDDAAEKEKAKKEADEEEEE
jgi:coronin-1B/1C/6